VRRDQLQRSAPRTDTKVHLSSVIKYMLRKIDPRRYGRDWSKLSDADLLRLEIGYLWEDTVFSPEILARLYVDSNLIAQPGFVRDGIHMTPDGYDVLEDTVVEVKFTSMLTAKPDHAKFRHWLWQNKGYCHGLGVTSARFIVLFSRGADAYGLAQPEAYEWRITYTPEELRRNWRMILVNRDEMLAEQKGEKG